MATARARFQAHVDSLPDGDFPVSLAWTFATATGTRLSNQTLAAGDNSFTPVAGTSLFILVPPTNNVVVLKAKGAGGDTGITLQPAIPTVLTWSAGVVIINAASQVTGVDVIQV